VMGDKEVVVVGEFTAAVLFVIEAGGSHIYLDEDNARRLRDDLNQFLGVDKQDASRLEPASPWYVGQVFPKGSIEPDSLPVGSQIKDHSNYQDIMEKTEEGWKWIKVLGSVERAKEATAPLNWDTWKDDSKYTLIRLGR
jgi:hypothetical protein